MRLLVDGLYSFYGAPLGDNPMLTELAALPHVKVAASRPLTQTGVMPRRILITGGAGFVLGSVVGALVIGLMTVLITRDGGIPPEATTIITGGILLGFVLLQRGIIGRNRR